MVEQHEFGNKRDAILYSAFQIFTEKGYHSAKVSEIAELAHVGKGTVYEYFSSKEDILRGVIEAGTTYYIEEVNKSVQNADDPLNKLKNMLKKHANMMAENQNFKQLIFHNFGIMTEQFHEFLNNQRSIFMKRIKEILNAAIAQKQIKPLDLEVGARMVLGSIITMDCDMGCLEEKQVDEMIERLLNGLK